MYLECISSYVSNKFSCSIERQWEVSNCKNTIVSTIVLKCAAINKVNCMIDYFNDSYIVPINKFISWHGIPIFKLVDPVYCNSCSILIPGVVSMILGKVAALTMKEAHTIG